LYKFKIADFFDSKQKFVQKTGDLQPFMRFCNSPRESFWKKGRRKNPCAGFMKEICRIQKKVLPDH